jgi:hypothetical protein
MFGTALLIVTPPVLPDDRPIAHRARRGPAQRDDLTSCCWSSGAEAEAMQSSLQSADDPIG